MTGGEVMRGKVAEVLDGEGRRTLVCRKCAGNIWAALIASASDPVWCSRGEHPVDRAAVALTCATCLARAYPTPVVVFDCCACVLAVPDAT